MNIYHPYPNVDSYDSFYPINMCQKDDIFDRFLNRGKYQDIEEIGKWQPLTMEVHSLGTKRGDFFELSAQSFVCNNRAWKLLEPLIGSSVQLLPVRYKDDTYFLLKVTNIIDCLDYDKADVFRFPETGKVLGIKKYAFKEELIKGAIFFAIPEIKFSILVSQKFKDCVEQNGLEGLLFRQVA